MKILVKVILALWIVMLMFSIYVWGTSYLDWKKENSQKIQEVYGNLWNNYQIWKHNKVNKLCNKNEEIWCLNWEVKWIRIINDNLYLYLYLYRSDVITTYPDGASEITKYSYNLFKNNKRKYVTNQLDIPKYWYLSNNELKFYSEKDLENLSEEQQVIFKELENNPTIIIDWVDYTKK